MRLRVKDVSDKFGPCMEVLAVDMLGYRGCRNQSRPSAGGDISMIGQFLGYI